MKFILLILSALMGAPSIGHASIKKTENKNVFGGTHWRIRVPKKGNVHVWVPKNYNRSKAGFVVYVHGYSTTADGTWKVDNLAQQFKKSRQNAMFVVPDGPSNRNDPVVWASLTSLKRTIGRANIRLPNGPTIVIGHSGAFRTISKWTGDRLLSQIILLDAMYGGHKSFNSFIAKGRRTKLIILGRDTIESSKAFAKKHPYAVFKKSMPARYQGFTKRERRSKLLFIKSQYDHTKIVRNQIVIPILLRLTPLKRLP